MQFPAVEKLRRWVTISCYWASKQSVASSRSASVSPTKGHFTKPSSFYPPVSPTVCPSSSLDKERVLLLERCLRQVSATIPAVTLSGEGVPPLHWKTALQPLNQTGPTVNRADPHPPTWMIRRTVIGANWGNFAAQRVTHTLWHK